MSLTEGILQDFSKIFLAFWSILQDVPICITFSYDHPILILLRRNKCMQESSSELLEDIPNGIPG